MSEKYFSATKVDPDFKGYSLLETEKPTTGKNATKKIVKKVIAKKIVETPLVTQQDTLDIAEKKEQNAELSPKKEQNAELSSKKEQNAELLSKKEQNAELLSKKEIAIAKLEVLADIHTSTPTEKIIREIISMLKL